MDINSLTVGQLKELTQLACVTKKKTKRTVNHGMQIAVLQRGWVFVGLVNQVGDDYFLTEGACIRRWGTTQGLGEIAKNGPTVNTELEPTPEVRFHEAGKVFMITVNEDKWAGKIK